MSGGCDVLSMGTDGLLKIDELQSGDTFGENSFQTGQNTATHNHTVITSQDTTEMLMIEPGEIESYLEKMKVIEQEIMGKFIRNLWLTESWNWIDSDFEKFTTLAEFVRFNKTDIVHLNCNSSQSSFGRFISGMPSATFYQSEIEKNLYFVVKGKFEVIYLLDLEKSSRCGLRVCYFEKNDYFGYFEKDLLIRAFEDDCEVIKISKQNFLSISGNSSFILSKLIEDYRINIPDGQRVIEFYRQRQKIQKLLNKRKL
jgi:CRP-like cAMP-binding protein